MVFSKLGDFMALTPVVSWEYFDWRDRGPASQLLNPHSIPAASETPERRFLGRIFKHGARLVASNLDDFLALIPVVSWEYFDWRDRGPASQLLNPPSRSLMRRPSGASWAGFLNTVHGWLPQIWMISWPSPVVSWEYQGRRGMGSASQLLYPPSRRLDRRPSGASWAGFLNTVHGWFPQIWMISWPSHLWSAGNISTGRIGALQASC